MYVPSSIQDSFLTKSTTSIFVFDLAGCMCSAITKGASAFHCPPCRPLGIGLELGVAFFCFVWCHFRHLEHLHICIYNNNNSGVSISFFGYTRTYLSAPDVFQTKTKVEGSFQRKTKSPNCTVIVVFGLCRVHM